MNSRNNAFWVMMLLLLITSCVQRNKEEQPETTRIDVVEPEEIDSLAPMWTYDYASDTPQYLGGGQRTLGALIRIVNEQYREHHIVLDSVDRRQDTVFVKIDSAHYMTSRMGSAGARDYMAVATYTLTEAEGTNYVSFDFQEGDHAAPGVYDRKHFQKK